MHSKLQIIFLRILAITLLTVFSLLVSAKTTIAQNAPISGPSSPDPFPGPVDGESWAVRPGSVYKEYIKPISGNRDWRVTGSVYTYGRLPGTNDDPGDFLPNPTITIPVDDLQQAIRAEAIISYWSGHYHTPDKRFKVNNNNWILLPQQTTIQQVNPVSREDMYYVQSNVIVEIPVSQLQQGNNAFIGDSDNQINPGFGWPQWGWTGIIVRVYYNSATKTGAPNVSITSPAPNSTIVHNQTPVTVSAPNTDKQEIIGYYLGIDEDGDGHYMDWHHAYFNQIRGTDMSIKGNIPQGPWDTTLVPNQTSGSIKLVARARAANGLWKVSPMIQGLSISRNFSVHMFPSSNIPQRFNVRGQGNFSSISNPISIPQALTTGVQSAQLYLRTWNGHDQDAQNPSNGDNPIYKFNNAILSRTGLADHDYAATFHNVPATEILTANTFNVTNPTEHHGVEVLWPSATALLRYNVPHNGGTGPTPTNTNTPTPTIPGLPTPTNTPTPTSANPTATPTTAPQGNCDYYTTTSGSDNHNGQTLNTAFRTIQKGVDNVWGGKTLCIGPGTYIEEVSVVKNGIGGRHTIIRALDPNDKPIIDGRACYESQCNNVADVNEGLPLTTTYTHCADASNPPVAKPDVLCRNANKYLFKVTANYITIDGLEIKRSLGRGLGIFAAPQSAFPIHDVIVQNSHIHHNRAQNITITEAFDIQILNNDLHHNGMYYPSNRKAGENLNDVNWGANFNLVASNNVIIKGNTFHETWGEGLVFDGNTADTRKITVQCNIFYDTWRDSIYLHGAHDSLISGNLIFQTPNSKHVSSAGDPFDGITLRVSEPHFDLSIRPTNNIIEDNIVIYRGSNFLLNQTDNSQVRNNTFIYSVGVDNGAPLPGIRINQNNTGYLRNNLVIENNSPIIGGNLGPQLPMTDNAWGGISSSPNNFGPKIPNEDLPNLFQNPAIYSHATFSNPNQVRRDWFKVANTQYANYGARFGAGGPNCDGPILTPTPTPFMPTIDYKYMLSRWFGFNADVYPDGVVNIYDWLIQLVP